MDGVRRGESQMVVGRFGSKKPRGLGDKPGQAEGMARTTKGGDGSRTNEGEASFCAVASTVAGYSYRQIQLVRKRMRRGRLLQTGH